MKIHENMNSKVGGGARTKTGRTLTGRRRAAFRARDRVMEKAWKSVRGVFPEGIPVVPFRESGKREKATFAVAIGVAREHSLAQHRANERTDERTNKRDDPRGFLIATCGRIIAGDCLA